MPPKRKRAEDEALEAAAQAAKGVGRRAVVEHPAAGEKEHTVEEGEELRRGLVRREKHESTGALGESLEQPH